MKSQKVREAQANGKRTILFDSGIRTGSDIFRALALGAQAVLRESLCSAYINISTSVRLLESVFVCAVGRPYAYGLVIAGQAGVEASIKNILADFELTLGLAGHKTVADIQGKADEVLIRAE